MSDCCIIHDHINATEVKKYKITPLPNRFIPDIINNSRIIEPGIYELNTREVNRIRWYGHVEEVIEEIPIDPPDPNNITNKIGHAKVGFCKLREYRR